MRELTSSLIPVGEGRSCRRSLNLDQGEVLLYLCTFNCIGLFIIITDAIESGHKAAGDGYPAVWLIYWITSIGEHHGFVESCRHWMRERGLWKH